MQLTTWLCHVVKAGEVTLFTGDVVALQVKAKDNKIKLCIADKEFLKDTLDSFGGDSSIMNKLAQLKSMAEELKAYSLTVTISYKNNRLVTMGFEAKPKFSRLVTGTAAMEINSLPKIAKLVV